jgi:hypothetical protein
VIALPWNPTIVRPKTAFLGCALAFVLAAQMSPDFSRQACIANALSSGAFGLLGLVLGGFGIHIENALGLLTTNHKARRALVYGLLGCVQLWRRWSHFRQGGVCVLDGLYFAFLEADLIVATADWTVLPLSIPPGTRTRGLLSFLFSARTMEHVFDPVLADHQAEWSDAMIAKHAWHARWISVRVYWHLGTHALAQCPVSVVRLIVAIWKAS